MKKIRNVLRSLSGRTLTADALNITSLPRSLQLLLTRVASSPEFIVDLSASGQLCATIKNEIAQSSGNPVTSVHFLRLLVQTTAKTGIEGQVIKALLFADLCIANNVSSLSFIVPFCSEDGVLPALSKVASGHKSWKSFKAELHRCLYGWKTMFPQLSGFNVAYTKSAIEEGEYLALVPDYVKDFQASLLTCDSTMPYHLIDSIRRTCDSSHHETSPKPNRTAVTPDQVQHFLALLVRVLELSGDNRLIHLLTHCLRKEVTALDKTASSKLLFRVDSIETKLISTFIRTTCGQFHEQAVGNPIRNTIQDMLRLCVEDESNLDMTEVAGKNTFKAQLDSFVNCISEAIIHMSEPLSALFAILTDLLLRPDSYSRFVSAPGSSLPSSDSEDQQGRGLVDGILSADVWNLEQVSEKQQTNVLNAINNILILRYLSSILISPEAWGIIPEPTSDAIRKRLVLISKCLQNIASGVPFGARDSVLNYLDPEIPCYHNTYRRAVISAVQQMQVRCFSSPVYSLASTNGNNVSPSRTGPIISYLTLHPMVRISAHMLTRDLEDLHSLAVTFGVATTPQGGLRYRRSSRLKRHSSFLNPSTERPIKNLQGTVLDVKRVESPPNQQPGWIVGSSTATMGEQPAEDTVKRSIPDILSVTTETSSTAKSVVNAMHSFGSPSPSIGSSVSPSAFRMSFSGADPTVDATTVKNAEIHIQSDTVRQIDIKRSVSAPQRSGGADAVEHQASHDTTTLISAINDLKMENVELRTLVHQLSSQFREEQGKTRFLESEIIGLRKDFSDLLKFHEEQQYQQQQQSYRNVPRSTLSDDKENSETIQSPSGSSLLSPKSVRESESPSRTKTQEIMQTLLKYKVTNSETFTKYQPETYLHLSPRSQRLDELGLHRTYSTPSNFCKSDLVSTHNKRHPNTQTNTFGLQTDSQVPSFSDVYRGRKQSPTHRKIQSVNSYQPVPSYSGFSKLPLYSTYDPLSLQEAYRDLSFVDRRLMGLRKDHMKPVHFK
eukprot:GILJ01016033.1.p1 GENE.GILJ01016033.1~~GILJ01016033.1.p1  ORF type:complete len:1005 (+),score=123.65 GILJ01016033.1:45-3059(+)